ncbi:MAG: CIA30 family protein [Chlorobiaceae bacterium]|nr:CIA30 family protein [Chlorobiaceae bacterium]
MVAEHIICDFENRCLEWRNVDDTVMGGSSKSSLLVDDSGLATFAGRLSLDRNGGFASVRTVFETQDYSGYDRFRIRLKGDGRRYDFRVRNNADADGLVYGCAFETVSGEWSEVDLPFSGLLPLAGGREEPQSGDRPFDSSNVIQICFLVAEQQKGNFNLQIDWIKAVRA